MRGSALLASTREGAGRTATEFQAVSFGLTVSITKAKCFAASREATNLDKMPLPVSGGAVDAVDEFPYLGSTIAASDCEEDSNGLQGLWCP